MRLLASASLLIFSFMLLGVMLVRGAALDDPPERLALLLPSDACPPPCWYGINPNQLTHAQTVEHIMTLPNVEQDGLLKWRFGQDGMVARLRFLSGRDLMFIIGKNEAGLHLGDVIKALGAPHRIDIGGYVDFELLESGRYLRLYYPEQRLIVVATLANYDEERFRPDTSVRTLMYVATPYPDMANWGMAWEGFLQRGALNRAMAYTAMLQIE